MVRPRGDKRSQRQAAVSRGGDWWVNWGSLPGATLTLTGVGAPICAREGRRKKGRVGLSDGVVLDASSSHSWSSMSANGIAAVRIAKRKVGGWHGLRAFAHLCSRLWRGLCLVAWFSKSELSIALRQCVDKF